MSAPGTHYFLPKQFRGGLAPNEISVISPFREQISKIRASVRNIALGAVNVGDVESLQGAEKYVCPYSLGSVPDDQMYCLMCSRVIIISTVRSSRRFLDDDQRFHRGVIFESKRFNVALTRAKELLIVVGNGDVLKASCLRVCHAFDTHRTDIAPRHMFVFRLTRAGSSC